MQPDFLGTLVIKLRTNRSSGSHYMEKQNKTVEEQSLFPQILVFREFFHTLI